MSAALAAALRRRGTRRRGEATGGAFWFFLGPPAGYAARSPAPPQPRAGPAWGGGRTLPPMLRTATHAAKKALTVPQYYGGGLLKVFTTEPVFVWAQAIAFKTLITLLPLVLLAVSVFGLVLRQEDAMEAVTRFVRGFLPDDQAGPLVELLLELQEASGGLTVFAGLFFLVTVVTMFATLRYVVGAAMGESRHRMRSILGGYLFDLRMMAQVGTLFLLSFAITTGAAVLGARSGTLAAQLGLDAEAVGAVAAGLVGLVARVVPYLLTVGMLAQLYYFVPRPKPPFRSAVAGAAVAAVVFELAKNGFAYYATHVADFDRFAEQGEGLGGLGGVFGLILAFVFWVYLSGLVLVVGGAVASLHEKRHRPRKARIRRLWSRMGRFRRHRERTEAEAADALAAQHAADESGANEGGAEGAPAHGGPPGEAASAAPDPGGDGAAEPAAEVADRPFPAASP